MTVLRKTLAATGLAVVATFGVGGFAATTASAASLPATSAHVAVADENYCGPGSVHVPNHFGSASFNTACQHHDACYSTGSTTDRAVCDNNFLGEMQSSCRAAYGTGLDYDACNGAAHTYYGAVHVGGRPFYKGSGNPA